MPLNVLSSLLVSSQSFLLFFNGTEHADHFCVWFHPGNTRGAFVVGHVPAFSTRIEQSLERKSRQCKERKPIVWLTGKTLMIKSLCAYVFVYYSLAFPLQEPSRFYLSPWLFFNIIVIWKLACSNGQRRISYQANEQRKRFLCLLPFLEITFLSRCCIVHSYVSFGRMNQKLNLTKWLFQNNGKAGYNVGDKLASNPGDNIQEFRQLPQVISNKISTPVFAQFEGQGCGKFLWQYF